MVILKNIACTRLTRGTIINRIAEILKRKSRKRLHEARKNERDRIGSESKGSQPTLPSIDVDLDNVEYNDNYSQHSGYQPHYQPSQYSGHSYPPNRNVFALQQNRSQDRNV